MSEIEFGAFLKKIRKRQNASELVKNVGISYVYLLDIEKGARSVPKKEILLSLAEHINFKSGEEETFFDLAADSNSDVPADIIEYIFSNKTLISLIRVMKKHTLSEQVFFELEEAITKGIYDE